MYDVNENPVGWFMEFVRMVGVLTISLLISGIWTAIIARSKLERLHKLVLCFMGIVPIACFSSWTFNSTNVKGTVLVQLVAACAFCFIIPLQACSWILKDKKVLDKISFAEIVLRTAMPAPIPTIRNPAENPWHQLARSFIYITIGVLIRNDTLPAIKNGGLKGFIVPVIFMTTVTTGILTFITALLGFLGFPSSSPFRKPLLSRTVASFWSGRWNAAVSDALRVGIYEPLIKVGVSRNVAAFACFFQSAISHELVFIYCGRYNTRGEWFIFFILAGLTTILEKKYEKMLPTGFARRLLSIAVVAIPFHTLFVPAVMHNGIAEQAVEGMGAVETMVRYLIRSLKA